MDLNFQQAKAEMVKLARQRCIFNPCLPLCGASKNEGQAKEQDNQIKEPKMYF